MVSGCSTSLCRVNVCLLAAKSPGVFDHVIINDDLEEAYKMFRNTISTSIYERLITF